ncbi:hypothetical protein [Jiella sp. M17.18]|uniref:hypothetical protein n=1 Tax=Jiella sp. M17.18 TaxID=3234247 RepID=UPI0034E051BE
MFDRKSRLLIPDNTPLSVLSLLGEDALNWLFKPDVEVWVTDMVREEAVRDPDPGSDNRTEQRRDLRNWFEHNADRIRVQETRAGNEYRKAMKAWELAGSPPELKPSWADRGEESIIQVLDGIENVLKDGEAVLVIMDDRKGRAALRTLNHDLDIMSTESFVIWMTERFNIREAESAWQTIALIMGKAIPQLKESDDEPVSTFRV